MHGEHILRPYNECACHILHTWDSGTPAVSNFLHQLQNFTSVYNEKVTVSMEGAIE